MWLRNRTRVRLSPASALRPPVPRAGRDRTGRTAATARTLAGWDEAVFREVAARHWPAAEQVLPRLSRGANHGLLWFGVAAAMAAVGGRPARRAAARGVASLALASATVNTVVKGAARRRRPLLDAVPLVRRLHRQPVTTSFPSGHAASAAAFAVGAALESRRWGATLAPLAWSVAFSRIYTGVHYPSDVLAGLALGSGAAFAVRGLVPTRAQLAPPARPRADAPALPGGRGLTVVLNDAAGGRGIPDPVARIRTLLPLAEVVPREDDGTPLAALLDDAARAAADRGGALGVLGGDGTVNAAAHAAVRHRVPLAVFPGGTRNHFAHDLGLDSVTDTCRAVTGGEAVAVDLGVYTSDGASPRRFVNTFSLGAYPDLVRVRESWAPHVGSWPAGVLAALRVLRTGEPTVVRINGEPRRVWLLFAGNCVYRGVGAVPVRRSDLADGLLDVRVVYAGRLPRTRLLLAALTGPVRSAPLQASARLRRLELTGLRPGELLAFDGEVARAPEALTLTKANEALTAYRPFEGS
ncbi:hypothetical protein SRB5_49030 [Streptomyces sp. RB5]|uniref:DAGKc domain-containing protein n=1 Tax=Streptomyces smaragdinus TaxID=2585196 RepID=A0A7K0CMM1_9ACTN|nr:phosphatase PAP2 family protein [Streptomyces smaragdinus]MQY14727.1 hypothetical protein [Streptomyces smaragdinus]